MGRVDQSHDLPDSFTMNRIPLTYVETETSRIEQRKERVSQREEIRTDLLADAIALAGRNEGQVANQIHADVCLS